MTYLEFQKAFGSHAVIDMRDVVTYFNGLDRRRLYEWQKKGHIRKVASDFYVFQDAPVDDDLLRAIAARIYQPSYLALESALAYYGLIPEAVFQMMSLTTRRGKTFETSLGRFVYRTIKRELFFGYQPVERQNRRFFISDPEKTLLDKLYFLPGADQTRVLDGLRLNLSRIKSLVNFERLRDYLEVFASPKLNRAVRRIQEMCHDSV